MYTEAQKRRHVYDLQRFLRRIQLEAGRTAPLTPDGVYGPETAAAVRDFQGRNGLPVTGRVDLDTWSLIYTQYAALSAGDRLPASAQFFSPESCAVLSVGDKGKAVYAVQLMLNTLAAHTENAARVPVSGRYDEDTAAAVRQAQVFFCLPETGRTDRDTWNALAAYHNAYHARPPLPWVIAEGK